jgi:hypothetical protein
MEFCPRLGALVGVAVTVAAMTVAGPGFVGVGLPPAIATGLREATAMLAGLAVEVGVPVGIALACPARAGRGVAIGEVVRVGVRVNIGVLVAVGDCVDVLAS